MHLKLLLQNSHKYSNVHLMNVSCVFDPCDFQFLENKPCLASVPDQSWGAFRH